MRGEPTDPIHDRAIDAPELARMARQLEDARQIQLPGYGGFMQTPAGTVLASGGTGLFLESWVQITGEYSTPDAAYPGQLWLRSANASTTLDPDAPDAAWQPIGSPGDILVVAANGTQLAEGEFYRGIPSGSRDGDGHVEYVVGDGGGSDTTTGGTVSSSSTTYNYSDNTYNYYGCNTFNYLTSTNYNACGTFTFYGGPYIVQGPLEICGFQFWCCQEVTFEQSDTVDWEQPSTGATVYTVTGGVNTFLQSIIPAQVGDEPGPQLIAFVMSDPEGGTLTLVNDGTWILGAPILLPPVYGDAVELHYKDAVGLWYDACTTQSWRLLFCTVYPPNATFTTGFYWPETINGIPPDGVVNNYSLSSTNTIQDIPVPVGGTTLTGMESSATMTDGLFTWLVNTGTGPLVLENLNAGSLADNQYVTPNGEDFTVTPGYSVPLKYDGTVEKWRLLVLPNLTTNGSDSTGTPQTDPNTLRLSFVGPGLVYSKGTGSQAGQDSVSLGSTSSSASVTVTIYTGGSGTWTKNATTKYMKVTVVGDGGGGGGVAGAMSQSAAAGGGGAGGVAIYEGPGSAFGATETYSVGAGGAGAVAGANVGSNGTGSTFTRTGFGTITGSGGMGGAGCSATTNSFVTAFGPGGAASNGLINIPGGSGGYGLCWPAATLVIGGNGGANILSAAAAPTAAAQVFGNNLGGGGVNYGGGGSGASSLSPSGSLFNLTGGAGAGGVIVVEEFQ